MSLLRIENLEVYYGHIHALKGLSLHVDQGQLVSLIGANGAGKSTLLNTITGVVRASAGQVVFKDQDIGNRRADQIVRLGIAHVPEGRKIFSELSVEENLRIGAYIRNDKALIKGLIEKNYELFPRLAERRRQEGGTLSGGEQQMLAIARGLMSEPELLLLDEPSLGLAPLLVDKIFEYIEKINKLGTSILLVEQNANIALQVSSYGYVLETGRIAHEAPSADLQSDDAIRRAYLGIA